MRSPASSYSSLIPFFLLPLQTKFHPRRFRSLVSPRSGFALLIWNASKKSAKSTQSGLPYWDKILFNGALFLTNLLNEHLLVRSFGPNKKTHGHNETLSRNKRRSYRVIKPWPIEQKFKFLCHPLRLLALCLNGYFYVARVASNIGRREERCREYHNQNSGYPGSNSISNWWSEVDEIADLATTTVAGWTVVVVVGWCYGLPFFLPSFLPLCWTKQRTRLASVTSSATRILPIFTRIIEREREW